MFKFFNKTRKRRGDTIIEVLVALFVVAFGSTIATGLVINSIQSNAYNRDNLIALNLAAEGLEAVRDIRDSNWLKFKNEKEKCWNLSTGSNSSDDCGNVNNLIQNDNYALTIDINTMKWGLQSKPSGSGGLSLSASAPSNSGNNGYRLYKDTIKGVDFYLAKASVGALNSGKSKETKFYRMITIDYPNGAPGVDKSMTVTSLVQWLDGNRVNQVKLTTELTAYNKVKAS